MNAFTRGENTTSPTVIEKAANMIIQIPTGVPLPSLASIAANTMKIIQNPSSRIPIAVFFHILQSPLARLDILYQIVANIGQRIIQNRPFAESNHAVGIVKLPIVQSAHPLPPCPAGPNS